MQQNRVLLELFSCSYQHVLIIDKNRVFYAWFIHVQELSSQILFYAIMVLGRNEVVVEITLHVRNQSRSPVMRSWRN